MLQQVELREDNIVQSKYPNMLYEKCSYHLKHQTFS